MFNQTCVIENLMKNIIEEYNNPHDSDGKLDIENTPTNFI
jgi:hypothetical protein